MAAAGDDKGGTLAEKAAAEADGRGRVAKALLFDPPAGMRCFALRHLV